MDNNKPMGPPPPYSAVHQQPAPSAYVPPGYGLPPQPPQGSYYPPAPAPAPPPPPPHMQGGQTVVTVQPVIVKVGDCPACRVGTLEDTFSCIGIMCAIFCFPLGLIPCLLLRNQFCNNCGAIYAGGAPRVYTSPTTVVGVATTTHTQPGRSGKRTTVYQAI